MSGIRAITMPKWGIEMQEGTITGWHKSVGEQVERGEELVDIETDKIVNTVESPASGTLRRIVADQGEVRSVGDLIGVFAAPEASDAAVDRFISEFEPADASFEPEDRGGDDADANADAPSPPPAGQRLSPIARKLAGKLGVDLSGVTGTGRNGRISKADVEAAAREQGLLATDEVKPAYEARRLTGIRRTAARRLQEAKREIPHFYLDADIDAAALKARADAVGVSLNTAVVKAMALALAAVPEANVQLVDEELRYFAAVDLGMAVATDRGLLAPVLREVASASLEELQQAATTLAERARSGRLADGDLTGGCATVSNLGMYGVDRFSAIVNPPQSSILAVGRLADRPWIVDDGVASRPVLSVTLSCDHRAIDGALAGRLLGAFRDAVETGLEAPS